MILISPLPVTNWCRAGLRSPRAKQLSKPLATTAPSHTDSTLVSHRLPLLYIFLRRLLSSGKKEKPSQLLVGQNVKLALSSTTYLHPKVRSSTHFYGPGF